MPDHVFARGPGRLPMAVRGDGIWIEDAEGRRYLDGSGGAAVSCLGHSDPDVRAAIHAQLDRIAFAHTGFFTSEPAEELADLLIAEAPPGIDRVYLVSGGSEAVEAAIKLARQYYLEIGEPRRHRLIARRQSYHGNTLGRAGRRRQRLAAREIRAPPRRDAPHFPLLRIPGPRGQRDRRGLRPSRRERTGDRDRAPRPRDRDGLHRRARRRGDRRRGPAVPGYFRRIREICDRHGVLLILDEVMCGMGRTGTFFACEQDGIAPDIVTIAKGLGAGYAPIGAMLASAAIHDAIAGGSGSFQHGHTYHGHPLAAAAGRAVVTALRDRGLVGRAARMGEVLNDRIRAAFGQHPHVGDIRGRGLFRALEFVADRETKATFDPARRIAARLKSAAMDEGLIVYPASGTIDGRMGDHVLIAPPFIIGETEIDDLVLRLDRAVARCLSQA
jgi:adenosylmethionine-8-amino-7-oxononanoate aminotransferase